MSVISSGFHISLTAWRSVSKDPWKGFCVLSHTYEAITLMKQLLLSQFSQEMPQSVPYDREDNLSVLCSCPWVCTLLGWLRMLPNMTVLYWLVGHGRGPQILGTHRYLPPYYVQWIVWKLSKSMLICVYVLKHVRHGPVHVYERQIYIYLTGTHAPKPWCNNIYINAHSSLIGNVIEHSAWVLIL